MLPLLLLLSGMFSVLNSHPHTHPTNNSLSTWYATHLARQEEEAIPKVTIQDTTLLKVIRKYMTYLKQYPEHPPQVLFVIQNGSYGEGEHYAVGRILRLNDILEHVPYAYTYVDNELVFLYAPNETLVAHSPDYLQSIKTLLNGKLRYAQVSEKNRNNPNVVIVTSLWNYNPWGLTIKSDGTYKLEINQ